MANDNIEQGFKALLEGVGDHLKSLGFSRRGKAFRRKSSRNLALIEVQRSQSSTDTSIRFTFNIAVVCGRLLEEDGPDISKAGTAHAHLRKRIGEFLVEPDDKWWELDRTSDPALLLSDLTHLLDLAAQFLADHVDDAKLTALWESGQSPGLTDVQRRRLLRELQAA